MAYIHERCKYNEIEYIGYMKNPHDLRETDIMRLLEEVEKLKAQRSDDKITYVKEKFLTATWRHEMLKRYFEVCIKPRITLTFKQIEEIEQKKLHPASRQKEYWSEKNKGCRTISDAWKSEGYELEKLDLENETITFRRLDPQSFLKIPEELMRQKLPEDAIFELETYFKYIIYKYGL